MNLWAEWAVTSSVLILIVVLLRAVLGKRLRAGVRYVLWGLVLLRLLVPAQLFAVPVLDADIVETPGQQETGKPGASLGGETPDTTPTGVPGTVSPGNPSTLPQDPLPGERPGNTQTPTPGDNLDDTQTGERDPNPGVAPEPGPDVDPVDTTVREPVNFGALLLWVWLGGAIATGLILAHFNLRFAVTLRHERRPLKGAACRLPVYVLEGLASPCLFGVFRPAVYLSPEAAEEPRMLRHVLFHEETHYRHGDHIWSLLRCAALAVHWWNPLVWLAVSLSRRDGELFCDEGALKKLGDGERRAYGNTLLTLVTAGPSVSTLMSCATTMSGGKKALRERISRIVIPVKRHAWAVALVLTVAVAAAACAFIDPVEKPSDVPTDDHPTDATDDPTDATNDPTDVTEPSDATNDPTEPNDPTDAADPYEEIRNSTLDILYSNTKEYKYVYDGAKEGDEAAKEAALKMAEMFMEDLTTTDELTFRVTEYRDLDVRLRPTLGLVANGGMSGKDEYLYKYTLLNSEVGEDRWIVKLYVEFRYEGWMDRYGIAPTRQMYEEEDGWFNTLAGYVNNQVWFLLTRDGNTYTMRSRLDALKEAGLYEPFGLAPLPYYDPDDPRDVRLYLDIQYRRSAVAYDNMNTYRYVYHGTKEGDEAAEEAALAMAEMFLDDLQNADDAPFRITQYRNPGVRVISTIERAETLTGPDGTRIDGFEDLLDGEVGPDKWLVFLYADYRCEWWNDEGWQGMVGWPTSQEEFEEKDFWFNGFIQGENQIGCFMYRVGDTFVMQSRMGKMIEIGDFAPLKVNQ